MELIALVDAAQRRLRLADVLGGITMGLLILAGSVAALGLAMGSPRGGAALGTLLAVLVAAMSARRASRRWTPVATATHIELAAGELDNLLVTATEIAAGRLRASERMRPEILRQAATRAAAVAPSAVAPLRAPLMLALAAAAGAVLTLWTASSVRMGSVTRPAPTALQPLRAVRATVTPPPYLSIAPWSVENAEQVAVPEGARVRLEVHTIASAAWLVEPGQPVRDLIGESSGVFASEWTPAESGALVIAVGDRAGEPTQARVMSVVVTPDSVPRVRVSAPGRDLALGNPSAVIDVAIEASDAERLDGLRLSYVKMSGSGESFAFAEGQIPVEIERVSPREWRGRARVSLAALKLDDGDSLVYRALARDSNPRADWVPSDAFTIDVGRRLELASAGSAVPDEDRRYALSQQMVIVKTERLQGERARLGGDAWTEQTRLLAMEQRMVRAEVVFLSGGEVEDEVAEAEQSSDLQEGRLQNAGRAEMLRAINEMSRAEARLNAGDTAAALAFERAALAALQRAFDRRRYFLRTLGERSRIDPARRLTGDLARAQSSARTVRPEPAGEPGRARELLLKLAAVSETGDAPSPLVLGHLAALEAGSADWRRLAADLASAFTPDARREAAQVAMARVAAYARGRAGATAPAVPVGDLRGWWREEWRTGGRP